MATASSYHNLPGVANWTPYKAPTTSDTVYFGALSSGKYAYVGPDNQPYIGTKSQFAFGSGGTVSPIIGQATPTSWSSLGVSNADNNVYESTYTGPGAQTQVQNDANYEALVAANPSETLMPNAGSFLGGAGGVMAPAGGQPPTTAPPPPTTSLPGAGTIAGGATNPNPSTGGAAQSDPSNLSGLPSIGASDPYQQALDSLLGNVNSAAAGTPGSGSVAAGLPIIEGQPSTQTTTGAPGWLLLVVLGALLLLGFWFWHKHHHGKSTAPSDEGGSGGA